ncbi:MAG: carboxypeptidase-like regulatory domain-containing protein [Thermoplasmatota archaeon]
MRVLAVLLATLVCGCAGPVASTHEIVVHSTPVTVASTVTTAAGEEKGHISGVVVDAGIHPLPGAIVKLPGMDLSDVARRDGSFSFTELIPSAYYLEVNATGYYPASTLVTVSPGEITRVKFVLTAVPPPTPYHITQTFNGFSDVTQDSLLGGLSACSGCSTAIALDAPAQALVVEATMARYSGADPIGNNSFAYTVRDENDPNCCDYLASGSGPNALWLELRHPNLGNATNLYVDVEPQSFPSPEFEKSFTAYVTAWYNALPPTGWSIVKGDS